MQTKPTRTLTALRLRLLRANVRRVAALAGVSTKTVYRIRSGAVDDISVSSADQLADALDFIARDVS